MPSTDAYDIEVQNSILSRSGQNLAENEIDEMIEARNRLISLLRKRAVEYMDFVHFVTINKDDIGVDKRWRIDISDLSMEGYVTVTEKDSTGRTIAKYNIDKKYLTR